MVRLTRECFAEEDRGPGGRGACGGPLPILENENGVNGE